MPAIPVKLGWSEKDVEFIQDHIMFFLKFWDIRVKK
jgi:hypothetical protein